MHAGRQLRPHLHGKAVADVLHGQVLADGLELIAGCAGRRAGRQAGGRVEKSTGSEEELWERVGACA